MKHIIITCLFTIGIVAFGTNSVSAGFPEFYTPAVCTDSNGLVSTECKKIDPYGPCDMIEDCKEKMGGEQ